MNSLQRIIKEVDGVQFYTDSRSGKSGISQSGLAILCGVTRDAVSKLMNSLYSKKPYNGLEHLVDKLSECRTETETGMQLCNDELCIAIIRYYDRKGKEEARFTFDKFAFIGFNHWVQSITGWSCDSPNDSANPPLSAQSLKALREIIANEEERLGLSPGEKPWTPPPLYPHMTREQWDGLSQAEKFYYSETKEEREMRRIRELREISLN